MASLTFKRVYVNDPNRLVFRIRSITSQLLVGESGIPDYLQDDNTDAQAAAKVPAGQIAFLEDDNGDKIA